MWCQPATLMREFDLCWQCRYLQAMLVNQNCHFTIAFSRWWEMNSAKHPNKHNERHNKYNFGFSVTIIVPNVYFSGFKFNNISNYRRSTISKHISLHRLSSLYIFCFWCFSVMLYMYLIKLICEKKRLCPRAATYRIYILLSLLWLNSYWAIALSRITWLWFAARFAAVPSSETLAINWKI